MKSKLIWTLMKYAWWIALNPHGPRAIYGLVLDLSGDLRSIASKAQSREFARNI
jgi:hypothetical protein